MFVKTNKIMAKHGQTVFLILLVALILPLILVFGPGSCSNMQSGPVSEDFGTIGTKKISIKEFKQHYFAHIITQFYLEPRMRQQPMLPSLRKAYEQDNIKRYGRGAVTRMQLLALARQQQLDHVNTEELKEYRDGLAVFQTKGKYDPAKYLSFREQYVKKEPISVRDFNEILKQNISIRRVLARFSGDYDSLAAARIGAVAGLAPLDYRIRNFPAPDPTTQTVTPEEIKKLYENDSKKYKTVEKRSGRIAVFKKVYKDLKIEEPTEKELAKYHAKHIRDYTKVRASHILVSYEGADRSSQERSKDEAKKRAEEALKKVNKDDFKKICLEYSDGPTRPKGGDLGWFSFDGMAKEFSEAAFKLKKGEITKELVETKFGFHIIMLTEEPKKLSWKSVEGILRKKIKDERLEAALEAKAKTQYEKERASRWAKHQFKTDYIRISTSSLSMPDEKKLDLDMAKNIRKELIASKKSLLKFHADAQKKYPNFSCTFGTREFYDLREPGLPEYLTKAAALKKGEITEVMEHGGSFYICQKVDERKEVPFEDAKSTLMGKLRSDADTAALVESRESADAFLKKIQKMKLTGEAVRKEFDKLANKDKVLVVDTPLMGPEDTKDYFGDVYGGIPNSTLNNFLRQLTDSQPLRDEVLDQPGFCGVLCLKTIEPSRTKTLDEATAEIKEELAKSKANTATFKKAQELFKKLEKELKEDLTKEAKKKLLEENGFVELRDDLSYRIRTPYEKTAAELVNPRSRKDDQKLLIKQHSEGSVIAYVLGYKPAKLEKVKDSIQASQKWQRKSASSTVSSARQMGIGMTMLYSGYGKVVDDMFPFLASERFRSILSDDDETKMTSTGN